MQSSADSAFDTGVAPTLGRVARACAVALPVAFLAGVLIEIAAVAAYLALGSSVGPDMPRDAGQGVALILIMNMFLVPPGLTLAAAAGIPATRALWRRGWAGPARMAMLWTGVTMLGCVAIGLVVLGLTSEPMWSAWPRPPDDDSLAGALVSGAVWGGRIGVIYGALAGVVLWWRIAGGRAGSRPEAAGSPPGWAPVFGTAAIALVLATGFWLLVRFLG